MIDEANDCRENLSSVAVRRSQKPYRNSREEQALRYKDLIKILSVTRPRLDANRPIARLPSVGFSKTYKPVESGWIGRNRQ